MQPIAINKSETVANSTINVPIDIEVIEPINELEIQYLDEEFLQLQEKKEYKHLAYSRY
ncbi:MAG: hypothetical protein HC815_05980 [Richelia sp. RM1_1_1]|nr:hypothetical protein [Richelia sp. RM1_1_1]